MRYRIVIIGFIIFALIYTIISFSINKNIIDAIDKKVVHDDYSVLYTTNVDDGFISLFERGTYKDIGVALIDKTKDKSKTIYGGYVGQNVEDPGWHYTSGDLNRKSYSIYYGRLQERPSEKVIIKLNNNQSKEATLVEASSSFIWFIVFNEKIEASEISIFIGEKSLK